MEASRVIRMNINASQSALISRIDTHVSIVGEIIDSIAQQRQDFSRKKFFLFNTQQQEKLANSWHSLRKTEIAELIDSIETLPIIPILPDSENQRIFIEQQRLNATAKSVWLKAMLLDETIHTKQLEIIDNFENAANLRGLKFTSIKLLPSSSEPPKFGSNLPFEILDRTFPLAEISKLILDLSSKTYPESTDLQILFPSAKILWICCEFSSSRYDARVTGITGKTIARSKRQTTNYNTSFINNLSNLGGKRAKLDVSEQEEVAAKALESDNQPVDRSEHLIDLLMSEAARLLGQSNDVVYEDFFRLLRHLNNVARNDSAYQMSSLLPDDRISITAKGGKAPKEPSQLRRRRHIRNN